MSKAAARMYISSAGLNYAQTAGINIDNKFRTSLNQLSQDATSVKNDILKLTYYDSNSGLNPLWRWLGISGNTCSLS